MVRAARACAPVVNGGSRVSVVSMRSLVVALALLAAAGCGGAAASPTNSGGTDAGGPADVPGDTFVGPGSAMITWTVNGQPPATGCAAANAVNVQIQVLFGNPVTVPCTAGQYLAADLPAGTYNVAGDLQDGSGQTIFQYTAPTVVPSGATADAVLAFGPPGSLSVLWTIGGAPATAARCMSAGVLGMQVQLGLGNPIMVNVSGPDGWACAAGGHRFTSVQPGNLTVDASVIDAMRHLGQHFTGMGVVTSGNDTQVTFDIAPPMM